MSSRSSNNPPQSFPGLHCVGWIKSAHGIRGELYVQLYAGSADWLDGLEAVWLLEPAGSGAAVADAPSAPTEWAVAKARPHKEGLILVVEGCADRNRAEELRKSLVYISDSLLVAEAGEQIFLKQILGFVVVDISGRRLGVVRAFGTNGVQDLLRVEREGEAGGGGEALVPFIDEFIVSLDFDRREIKMDLPEGLLDIE